MKVVDSAKMTEIDRRTQDEYGFPGIVLMENAGLKSYQLLKRSYWNDALPKGLTAFVVGKGNNGGDAMVIARQLYLEGYRGGYILCAAQPDKVQTEMCSKLGISVLDWSDQRSTQILAEASTIVDGLTGTGIRGALRPPLESVVEAMNAAPGFKIAVDVPSGVGDSFRPGMPAVRADVTITMGLPKLSLYLPSARTLCGEIHVVDLGFPRALTESEEIPGSLLTFDLVREMVPEIGAAAYKNRRGTVGVFAGTEGTTGAAVLAANGAAHSRAGLVNLFIDRSGYQAAASQLSAVMVRPADYSRSPETFSSPVPLERFDSRVVGPGWGRAPDRLPWLRAIMDSGPGVLDADGISLFASDDEIARPLRHPWILTPHPGEFSRLTGIARDELMADPLPHLLEASRSIGATIVLKSHVTYIVGSDGRYWILDGMNPALGTGGSGDLLAGIIGGFLAGGLDATAAACAGVFVHHRAGKRGFAELGWFTANELLPFVAREARLDERSAGL